MAHANNPQSTPKKKGGKWKWVVLAIIVLFFVSMCAGLTSDDDEGENGAAGGTTTSEVAPETEPEVQEPEAPLTPEQEQEALAVAIRDKTGEDTIVEFVQGKDVKVTMPITGVVRKSWTISALQKNTVDIIKLVQESNHEGGAPYLSVNATADMVDPMGNSSNERVLLATYWPETIAQINPDGIIVSNVWDIADERLVHPELQN